MKFIDEILREDQTTPRKQRHTAHRIWERIRQERSDSVAEATVRRYVRARKQELGLTSRETFVPQVYDWGGEAQVDWYEAMADFAGERLRVYIFAMRSMASGGAFHVAYYHATQQAFLEAHELAFSYFGGVFRCLRYDNLKSAVKKILRGHQREETERLIAFRSHWGFQTEFCNPARGNEKGGVEGEVGYFRRNHLVPIPQAKNLSGVECHPHTRRRRRRAFDSPRYRTVTPLRRPEPAPPPSRNRHTPRSASASNRTRKAPLIRAGSRPSSEGRDTPESETGQQIIPSFVRRE